MKVNPPVHIDRAQDWIRRELEGELAGRYGEPVGIGVNNIDARSLELPWMGWGMSGP